MHLDINIKGKRTLNAMQSGVFCDTCKIRDWQVLYYCEQDNKLYCYECLCNKLGCSIFKEHIDYKLDEVKIINEKHIMNKELLKNEPNN